LTEKLEDALRKIVGDAKLEDAQAVPECCVAVMAVKKVAVGSLPDLVRTYMTRVCPYDCTILEAARATFAAMMSFPPAKVQLQVRHGRQVTYLAGGLGYNNPTRLALDEARQIWGPDDRIGCIVSIGTGISPHILFEGTKIALAEELQDILTDCRAVNMSIT
jgi:hypothetical protein